MYEYALDPDNVEDAQKFLGDSEIGKKVAEFKKTLDDKDKKLNEEFESKKNELLTLDSNRRDLRNTNIIRNEAKKRQEEKENKQQESQPSLPAQAEPQPSLPAQAEPQSSLPAQAEPQSSLPAQAEPQPSLPAQTESKPSLPQPEARPDASSVGQIGNMIGGKYPSLLKIQTGGVIDEIRGLGKTDMDKLEESTAKLEKEYEFIHSSIGKLLSRESDVQETSLALDEYGKYGEKITISYIFKYITSKG